MKLRSLLPFISCCFLLFQACAQKSRTPEEVAQNAFDFIRNNEVEKMKAMAMTEDEFMTAMENADPDFKTKNSAEKKKLVAEDMKHRLITIQEDFNSIRKQYCNYGTDWEKASFSTSFYRIDTADNAEFSAILVEFLYAGKREYFEIECVKTKNGWKIFDDLNFHSYHEANEDFIKGRNEK